MERPRVSGEDAEARKVGIAQLEAEGDARQRRIQMRKERVARLAAQAKSKRRQRAFKLAGVWAAIIVAAFFALVWFSPEFSVWIQSL